MSDLSEAFRLIGNLIRTGTVFAVDLQTRPAKVRIQDGEWQSGWLQWLELRAGTTKTWNPPTAGEQVLALCPGGDTVAGYVLAGLNSDSNPAPSESANEHVTTYPDGARIVYDHAAGALMATGMKTVRAEVAQSFTIKCPNIILDGKTTVTDLFTYQSGLSGKDGKGNFTEIRGNLRHTDGEIRSNGVVLHTHRHPTNGLGAPTDSPIATDGGQA